MEHTCTHCEEGVAITSTTDPLWWDLTINDDTILTVRYCPYCGVRLEGLL